jgi:2-dehydro-3-deoxyglucarate aldolase/4-hydroxy-2-oxoheptanedioate aldolase
MENANKFRNKIRNGQPCLGLGISFNDPAVTESLCTTLDFVWIDMEHNAMCLETVQGHIMATKGSDTAPLVRVRWNDPVLIKPVLDIGAAGVIVPMVRNAEEAKNAVAACRYPPDGIRGFGPKRPSDYGRHVGPEFCKKANESIIVIAQIEHIDAINNINEILAVPGLTGIVFGPYDLSGSMGHMGEPGHPEVKKAMERVVAKARKTNLFIGIGVEDARQAAEWLEKGVNGLVLGGDFSILVKITTELAKEIRSARHPEVPAQFLKDQK